MKAPANARTGRHKTDETLEKFSNYFNLIPSRSAATATTNKPPLNHPKKRYMGTNISLPHLEFIRMIDSI